jgi:repressor LexA
MREAPTLRQLEVLRLIAKGIEGGLPPTNRELCEALGFASTHSAACHIAALIKKGYLDRIPNRARALSLTSAGRASVARRAA